MPTPILVDTDMALDDWMAIALLRASPSADLRAITIAAAGEAHAKPGVKNALRLCALVDDPVSAAVDVAAGRDTPLAGGRSFPWFVRLLMDWRFGFFWPAPKQQPSTDDAVAVLRRQLMSSTEPLTIVAIGPLTNLAELLAQHPEVKPKIARVVSMGGALDVKGNLSEMIKTTNTTAEWNFYIDPTAGQQVLAAGVPVSLVPLDATNGVPLTQTFVDRLKNEATSPAGRLVYGIVKRIQPLMKNNPFCFWDPITAVLALRPELGTWRDRRVVVVEDGDEAGRVKDVSAEGADRGAVVSVCVAVDRAGFEDAFIAALNGRG